MKAQIQTWRHRQASSAMFACGQAVDDDLHLFAMKTLVRANKITNSPSE
jgi:hypothetical protein